MTEPVYHGLKRTARVHHEVLLLAKFNHGFEALREVIEEWKARIGYDEALLSFKQARPKDLQGRPTLDETERDAVTLGKIAGRAP